MSEEHPERIYLSPPDVGEDERRLLLDAFDSGWIAPLGPHVDAFEAEVAARAGVGHGAALSSGTAGLHLALLIAGVGPGERVATSTMTFVATANAIVYTGAEPVFIDVDPATWQLDPDLLAQYLEDAARGGDLPKAVVTVDLYGQCCDYDRIVPLCEQYDVMLIEDAAEALGANYRSRPAGSFGMAGVFSFNGNKIITTGGGGMLVSDDEAVVARARHLATQAREPAPHYEHVDVGYNYRMGNLSAALGRGQLLELDTKIARRRAIRSRYEDLFAVHEGFAMMPIAAYGEPNYWLTCVTVGAEAAGTRDDLLVALQQANIEARPLWKPMHCQPLFQDALTFGGGNAAEVFAAGMCLPSGSSLSDAQVERVLDRLEAALDA